MSIRIRHLHPGDLPDLLKLTEAAGWNHTQADWLRFLRYDPLGCFGADEDGRVISSAACINYGQDLAWIAMVLTLPEYRGQGLARRLMETALAWAGSRVTRLDASDMGQPLYESLGFHVECPIERWRREGGSREQVTWPEPATEPVRWDRDVDREIFGGDRDKLLMGLAQGEAASVGGGYAFGWPGEIGPYFGPCVALTDEEAVSLFRWFVGRHAEECCLTDLFPHHASAVRIASELGFRPVRQLMRMVRRPALPRLPDRRIYTTGSFSWG